MAGSSTSGKFSQDLMGNPSEIKIRKLIENRASEIAMTLKDVKKKLPQLTAQRVPHHMRRRSVSHNVKRLPKRVQDKARKEASVSKKSKRPSRKYRRRPSNLLEEYGRRQGPAKACWLETHVWLAKRFHMGVRWGYKLPLASNDKGARATYRAASNFCLLHDLSYYGCLELLGPQEALLQGLRQLCSQETGLTFAAKTYLPGTREGTLVMYRANCFPYNAIGPVSFLWKPVPPDKGVDCVRQLWIWTHPACYEEVVAEICSVLKLPFPEETVSNTLGYTGVFDTSNLVDPVVSKLSALDSMIVPVDNRQTDIKAELKHSISAKTLPGDLLTGLGADTMHTAHKDKDSKVDINGNLDFDDKIQTIGSVLKSAKKSPKNVSNLVDKNTGSKRKAENESHKPVKKVKFEKAAGVKSEEPKAVRVTPEEQQVFTNETVTLRLLKDKLVRFRLTGPKAHAVLQDTLKTVEDAFKEESQSKDWWRGYYARGQPNQELLRMQGTLWEEQRGVISAACLCPGYALALTVRDPRVIALPKSKVNALTSLDSVSSSVSQPPPTYSSLGPIWDQAIRDKVTETKIPQNELNRLKSLLVIPGSDLDIGEKENKVPVMLLQNPGFGNSGSNSGWDLVLPSGWAMPFWISLVYRGARISALQELHRACVDQEAPLFPDHYGDTRSGAEHQESCRRELMTKHFRYPPDKRPNFQKLGVASPFMPPWKELVVEWKAAPCQHFYVLRNKRVLKQLSECLTLGQRLGASLRDPKFDDALVFVSAECLFKGVLSEYATLCLPHDEDFFQLKHINRPSGPTEKRHRPKKGAVTEKNKSKNAQMLVEKVPEVEGLLELCSRKPIGYLGEGRFSFLKAKGAGIGFCAYKGFLQLTETCLKNNSKLSVLVRAQNSMQYRFARIKLVT